MLAGSTTGMNTKPEIIFSFPACMGGVASFNFNIINNSSLIKQFNSTVILLKPDDDQRPVFTEEFQSDNTITFHYSAKENKQYLLKRLNKFLGETPGAIVTDNSLTIEAAAFCKNPKTVFSLIHDYYYVNQNIHLADLADVAIAHSSFFSDAVYASNPRLFTQRSLYIPYGVRQLEGFPSKASPGLNLVYLGRLAEEKGVQHLWQINTDLLKRNIPVQWTIIGKGALKQQLLDQWKDESNVAFHEPETTAEVYGLLNKQDIFVFPTSFEGTPVSILECMANGVITITHDLPGGIRDIVKRDLGFTCTLNNIDQFVEKIEYCFLHKEILRKMQKACFKLSRLLFDIHHNSDNYFIEFLQFEKFKRKKKTGYVKFSRLDKAHLPNKLVKWLRSPNRMIGILTKINNRILSFFNKKQVPSYKFKRGEINKCRLKYKLELLIETGTFLGDTVDHFKNEFKKIISIELSETLACKARLKFQSFANVRIITGDSGRVLADLISEIHQPALFWLDGHYSSEFFVGNEYIKTAKGQLNTPIMEELKIILRADSSHVILIDDARLFTGKEDYPTITQLRGLLTHFNTKYSLTVKNDIIYIFPNEHYQ
jgi:glycosyltransferase involved in cell wall biosynthesis